MAHQQHTQRHARQSIPGRINRLPIPTLGHFTPLIGVAGLVIGLALFGVVGGLVLSAIVTGDALNPFHGEDVVVAMPGKQGVEGLTLPSFLQPNPPNRRVTIVLLGADTRPAETGYRTPTDTIMLLTIDPQAGTAGIVSLPRDLYVDIPGYGPDRINTAYVRGGGQLVMDTIAQDFGIQVDHYVLVQFDAFVTLVDQIGGIDVNVPTEIYDPEFPAECYSRDNCGFDPLYIPAGQQHFDGWTALRYARVRHTDNDYERARRQQVVLFAIRDRIVSLQMLPVLVQRAPALYATLTSAVRTDLTLDELLTLAQQAAAIDRANIRSAVVDGSYVTPFRTSGGADVLQPDYEKIDALIADTFGTTP